MKYCNRCVMPDTKPGVSFDERGLCNACRSQEQKKHIDWDARAKELDLIVEDIKKKKHPFYDCVIPVSGGKNSWYQALVMAKRYDLKCLCVCLGAHLPTTEGIHNLNTMIEDLGVDLIKITLKPSVYRNIRKKCFVQQGEPNWGEHCSMFSSVVNTALIYEVPLIVWGEDIAFEYGGIQNTSSKPSALDIDKNDLIKQKTVHDWLDDDIHPRDVFFYEYPDYDRLKEAGIHSIYLGHYEFWDGRKQYEIVKERGFHPRAEGPLPGNYIDYDNIDEKLCEINIWLKYIKFGFWRATDQTCYDIWTERLTRDEAVDIVNEIQGEFPSEYYQDFLRFHNITDKEFWEVVEKFRNKDIWEKKDGKWSLRYPLKKLSEINSENSI
ncbi:MAG: N-acetyl sugar amidotransferase [Oligoflexales bacterium]